MKFIDMVMVKSAQNNKIGFLFVLFILLIGNGCSDQNMDNTFYQNVLGVNLVPEEKVMQYDEESARNEGYSLEVIRWHALGKLNFKEGFPITDDYRKGWSISGWQETAVAINEDFDPIFKHFINKEDVRNRVNEARKLLMSTGNYYCYFFKKKGDYVDAVNLYILDTQTKLLYVFYVVV